MHAIPDGRPVRVFVAGASGAIGSALVPKLVEAGYEVTAMTRSAAKVDALRSAGAAPVVCDVFDPGELRRVVAEAQPDVVVNQLTELPKSGLDPAKLQEYYARNDRVRREGTDNLLAAARSAGAKRYIGQSVAFFYAPEGGKVKSEEAPLWTGGPSPFGAAAQAIQHAETSVLEAPEIDGIVLRYGTFYGPNTWYAAEGEIGRQVKKRRYPTIGAGEGVTSFVHIDDAAAACVVFVERGRPGVYNLVDDEPAPANEWLPAFAAAIGAKRPRRVPAWLAKMIAGRPLVEWATTLRGASNERVKRELGWTPRYASWRQGFREALAR